MSPSGRNDMMETYSDPTGAVLILSNATHTGAFDCRNANSEAACMGHLRNRVVLPEL